MRFLSWDVMLGSKDGLRGGRLCLLQEFRLLGRKVRLLYSGI